MMHYKLGSAALDVADMMVLLLMMLAKLALF